jgi:hypothetical protein
MPFVTITNRYRADKREINYESSGNFRETGYVYVPPKAKSKGFWPLLLQNLLASKSASNRKSKGANKF